MPNIQVDFVARFGIESEPNTMRFDGKARGRSPQELRDNVAKAAAEIAANLGADRASVRMGTVGDGDAPVFYSGDRILVDRTDYEVDFTVQVIGLPGLHIVHVEAEQ